MIFYEDNGQNLKTMLHFIQTKKKNLIVNLMMKNTLASALFYNNLENFAMKSQQNLSVFCKTDKQCVCVHSIQTEKKFVKSPNHFLQRTIG